MFNIDATLIALVVGCGGHGFQAGVERGFQAASRGFQAGAGHGDRGPFQCGRDMV